jgi:hypothetical protein
MGKAPASRLVLAAAAISAIFFLATAACAQGETNGDAAAPLTPATEDTASTEQTPAPTPPAEAPVEGVETQAPESVGETAGATVESDSVTSAVPAASETVRGATSEPAHKAIGVVSPAAATELGTTAVTATGDHASKLVGEVGQVTEKAVTAVGDQTEHSGLSKEAGTEVVGATAFGNPARAEGLLQPDGTRPSGVLSFPNESPASRGKAPSTHGATRPVGVSPRARVGWESSRPGKYPAFATAELSWLRPPESLNGIQSTSVRGTSGTPQSDRAPLDGPMPAPGSSGAAAGSAGSFFVPLAALLALLALAAPAILRRLGEAPDFGPPPRSSARSSTPARSSRPRPGLRREPVDSPARATRA